MITAGILATDHACGLSRGGAIPWAHALDLRLFSALTAGHTMIMGRRTYETLPARMYSRDRTLRVVTSSPLEQRLRHLHAHAHASLEDALAAALEGSESIAWVCGGARLYRAAARLRACQAWVHTWIPGHHGCDLRWTPPEGRRLAALDLGSGAHAWVHQMQPHAEVEVLMSEIEAAAEHLDVAMTWVHPPMSRIHSGA